MFLRKILEEFLYINILSILDQLTLVSIEKEVLGVLFCIVSSIQQDSKTSPIYEFILVFRAYMWKMSRELGVSRQLSRHRKLIWFSVL